MSHEGDHHDGGTSTTSAYYSFNVGTTSPDVTTKPKNIFRRFQAPHSTQLQQPLHEQLNKSNNGNQSTAQKSPPHDDEKSVSDHNESDDDDDDDDMMILSGFAPTPRSPEDDITLALQQQSSTDSLCSRLCEQLMSRCCGCCCCCVYTTSESSQLLATQPHVPSSSLAYWKLYPFMRTAHRVWKLFLLCYALLSVPFIYWSSIMYRTSCVNSDIFTALQDVMNIDDPSNSYCNLYYWLYIWLLPLLLAIVTRITERVTLHDDMRGDRLLCLLNLVCLLIVAYLFVFMRYVNDALMDNICGDYQSSSSDDIKSGCKKHIGAYPLWIVCNALYLVFLGMNLVHERVISFRLTLYDFKPTVLRYRCCRRMHTQSQTASSQFALHAKRVCTAGYWHSKLIAPLRTSAYHVVFNIFHLDRHNMKLGVFYVWSEVKRNHFSFLIGLFAVFLSCFVAAFLPAIDDKAGVVFVKLAENYVGESDMLLTASFSEQLVSLNAAAATTSQSAAGNATHNETLAYVYHRDWLPGASQAISAANFSAAQLDAILQDVEVNNASNLTQTVLNATGLTLARLTQLIDAWNDNNDAVAQQIGISDQNNLSSSSSNAWNLSDGAVLTWTVPVRDSLMRSNPMINYSYIEARLWNVSQVSGSAPRWWLLGNVTAGQSAFAASSIVMAIDSALELDAGIGRAWKDVAPLQGNQAYIMDTVTRAMNITPHGGDDYNLAVGVDFVMFANLGGLQSTFDLDFAGMFLETAASVQLEASLIEQGIARSCIQVYVAPNARAQDFAWTIYDERVHAMLATGSVYQNTNTCIVATSAMNYTFRITDAFGNGLQNLGSDDDDDGEDGFVQVAWDGEVALLISGKFEHGWYEQQILQRPASAYGHSHVVLNDTEQDNVEFFLENFLLNPQVQTAIFEGSIAGDTDLESIQMTQAIIDEVMPQYNATEMVRELQNASYNDSVELVTNWVLYYLGFGAQLQVAQSVPSGDGKWSSFLGSVTVIDVKELSDILLNATLELSLAVDELVNAAVHLGVITAQDTIRQIETLKYYMEEMADSDLYEYAVQTIVMYTHRLEAYMGTMLEMDDHMLKFSNAVFDNLGVEFMASISLPIYEQFQFLSFFKLFLSEMMFQCVVLMTTLVLMVIYSLLLNDVEERTYTYGMLRALGMKRVTLIQIMLLKAISFSIPATLLALAVAQLSNIPLIRLIEEFAHISLSMRLPSISFVNGMLVGFVVPMVAIYVPTSRALSKTLRDSLDVYHHVASDLKVTMIRLEKLGFSVPIMGVAVILVSYGIVCSVLVPISVYYQKDNVCLVQWPHFKICFGSGFDLFFGIFASILLTMIYGMCIIASLLAMPLANALVKLFLCCSKCPHFKLQSVVLKNLNAHSARNTKTAIMFITTLSFCIFAGVSNSFLAHSAVDFFAWLTGADFEIITLQPGSSLPVQELSTWLDTQRELGKIEDYTYVTNNMWDALRTADMECEWMLISSLAGTPEFGQWVVGVPPNYMNVMFDRFLDIHEVGDYHNGSIPRLKADPKKYDVVQMLYSDAGAATMAFEEHGGIRVPPPVVSGKYWTADGGDSDRNDEMDGLQAQLNASYTDYIDVIISTSLLSALAVDIGDPLKLSFAVQDNNYKQHYFVYMLKVRAVLNKAPGLVMLPYDVQYASFLAAYQNAIISLPAYEQILTEIATALDVEIPTKIWQKFAIKMQANATDADFDDINQGIRTFVPDQTVEVSDMHTVKRQLEDNISLINSFFLILGILGLVLSFFILWLSFLANVRNSSWELGVLRSLGINTVQVTMIYIYEALSIVIACIVLGTIIGVVTAFMLCSQSNLFLMMPLTLNFPWTLFIAICTMSLTVAVVGSFLPIIPYITRNVATVLSGK